PANCGASRQSPSTFPLDQKYSKKFPQKSLLIVNFKFNFTFSSIQTFLKKTSLFLPFLKRIFRSFLID
ncbi:hypothetical protein, partial [Escherichia coli]|uniref:hypothetical protein n=1 Tax=Escherichia coli TaxID=562 RepID=UPI003CF8275C